MKIKWDDDDENISVFRLSIKFIYISIFTNYDEISNNYANLKHAENQTNLLIYSFCSELN